MWPFDKNKPVNTDDWNDKGRKIAAHNSAELAAFHTGRKSQPNLRTDRRGHKQAMAVLDQVVSLNRDGNWAEARQRFDPAHAPFIPELEKPDHRGLSQAIILGEDTFLIRKGATYQGVECLLIDGTTATALPDLHAFAISRNRACLALVHADGRIIVQRGWDGPVTGSTNWPEPEFFRPEGLSKAARTLWSTEAVPPRVSALSLSDDGQRLLVVDDETGIFLIDFSGNQPERRLVYPDTHPRYAVAEFAEDMVAEDPDTPLTPLLDMVHGALSPCGGFIGIGTQDEGHYLLRITPELTIEEHARLGHHSEYPHLAHFSDDSTWVAFNSCHFYNGATIVAKVAAVEGLRTSPYEAAPETPVINPYLRGYAAAWLPQPDQDMGGAFVIAGAGYANATGPDGTELWELYFGSSAGAIDVAPDMNRMIIASYSGMLHILDLTRKEDPTRIENWNAPKETKRWIFWPAAGDPVQW